MKKMKKFNLLLAALLLTLLIPVCKPTTIQAATLKAPKTLAVKQGKNNISIQWSKVPGAKGYVVYRKNSPSQGWKRLKVVKAPTVKYLDKNIASGKSYYYTVRPYTNKSGKNSYGSYNKSGRNTVYLKEPKVTATKSHKSVTLKWNKTTGASGYEVYRKSGNSGYSKVKTTTALSYKDTAVEPNTKYTYAVRAYKKSGSSVFRSLYYDGANLVSVKTQAEVQDPVEPDPEPSVPDINDAVESKVYFNEYGGIIEVYNKSIYTYYSVQYVINFYDSTGHLTYRIPLRDLCTSLKPGIKDYSSLGLTESLSYAYYRIELSSKPQYKDYDDFLKYIKVGDLYTKDNNICLRISSDNIKTTYVYMKFVQFDKNIPLYVIGADTYKLGFKETKELVLATYLTECITNIENVKIIVEVSQVL